MVKTIGQLEYENLDENTIGKGSFGVTYSGFYSDSCQPVAVKIIQKSQHDVRQMEIEVMEKASGHPNILRYICKEEDNDYLYIATELCNGTLEDYFIYYGTKYKGPKFESDWQILYQATQGLAYLHQKGIIHRDIKPTNILVFVTSPSNEAQLKLADFGISKILEDEKNDFTNTSITDPTGTKGWMAPEVYESKRFDFKVDIWALGCIFGYTLSVGNKHPFGDNSNERIVNIIRKEQLSLLTQKKMKEPYSGDDVAIKLIKLMLDMQKPENRPTAEEILKNRFFVTDSVRTQQFLEECRSLHSYGGLLLARFQKKLLLEDSMKGVSVNIKDSEGLTPLHWLCCYKESNLMIKFVQLLIQKGADVNAKTSKTKETPLHLLCKYDNNDNQIEIAKLLMENGADVNTKTQDGWTSLHFLCRYYKKANLIDFVDLLIKKGADVKATTNVDLETSLHLVCQYYKNDNLVELSQLLIKNGAKITALTREGRTPFYVACVFYKNARLSDLLQLFILNRADFGLTDLASNNKNSVLFLGLSVGYCALSLLIVGIIILAAMAAHEGELGLNIYILLDIGMKICFLLVGIYNFFFT